MTELIAENWIIAVAVLWTIPWKGVALWRATKNNDKGWFIALLIISTFGLLEAAYIFHFGDRVKIRRKKKEEDKK